MADFLFWSKKFLTWLCAPISLVLILQLLGFFLILFTRHKIKARCLIVSGWVFLYCCATSFLPEVLVQSLQAPFHFLGSEQEILHHYPEASSIKKIVVLGGGAFSDPTASALGLLPRSALLRVLEAVRLHQIFPNTTVVMCGGTSLGKVIEAKVMRQAAIDLGVTPDCLETEERSRDTQDQANSLRSYVGEDPFFLITSAWHMKRSVGLIQKLGLHPIPAPVNFETEYCDDPSAGHRLEFPFASYIGIVEMGFKEWLGITWSVITGKI